MTSTATMSGLWRDHEKLRFLAVGTWNTVFAYIAFATMYLLLAKHIHYLWICLLTHVASVTNAFICQRTFVFRSDTNWRSAYLRFNLVQLIMLMWGMAGLALTVERFRLHPLIGQILVMALGVIASYILSRRYAFRA